LVYADINSDRAVLILKKDPFTKLPDVEVGYSIP
jgi:hypothetical protein